jgi:hypothetical protein
VASTTTSPSAGCSGSRGGSHVLSPSLAVHLALAGGSLFTAEKTLVHPSPSSLSPRNSCLLALSSGQLIAAAFAVGASNYQPYERRGLPLAVPAGSGAVPYPGNGISVAFKAVD